MKKILLSIINVTNLTVGLVPTLVCCKQKQGELTGPLNGTYDNRNVSYIGTFSFLVDGNDVISNSKTTITFKSEPIGDNVPLLDDETIFDFDKETKYVCIGKTIPTGVSGDVIYSWKVTMTANYEGCQSSCDFTLNDRTIGIYGSDTYNGMAGRSTGIDGAYSLHLGEGPYSDITELSGCKWGMTDLQPAPSTGEIKLENLLNGSVRVVWGKDISEGTYTFKLTCTPTTMPGIGVFEKNITINLSKHEPNYKISLGETQDGKLEGFGGYYNSKEHDKFIFGGSENYRFTLWDIDTGTQYVDDIEWKISDVDGQDYAKHFLFLKGIDDDYDHLTWDKLPYNGEQTIKLKITATYNKTTIDAIYELKLAPVFFNAPVNYTITNVDRTTSGSKDDISITEPSGMTFKGSNLFEVNSEYSTNGHLHVEKVGGSTHFKLWWDAQAWTEIPAEDNQWTCTIIHWFSNQNWHTYIGSSSFVIFEFKN